MKKVISTILAAGLIIAAMSGMAMASNGDEYDSLPPLPHYLAVSGKIVSINDYYGQPDWLKIVIDDDHGNPGVLVINENTVFPFSDEYQVGDVVTGFYLANVAMITIWPPQYTTAILVAGMPDGLNVKADRFFEWEGNSGDYLLSQGGQFAFRTDESTEIILANGDDFSDGDIIGRRLVVIYGMSTRSLPELATAQKVIVLYEDAVPLPDMPPAVWISADGWPILVDEVEIEAMPAYQTEDGYLMVPLGAILQALEMNAVWDGDTRTVTINDTIWFVIGDYDYNTGDEETIVIEGAPAPAIVDDRTFVPLQFFTQVLDLPNAFAFEGRIEIHSVGERME